MSGSAEMRVSRLLAGGALLAGLMLAAVSAQAAQVVMKKHVVQRQYTISGGDELQLLREMRRKGPRVGGKPALASTRLQARYSARLLRRGGMCRVRALSIQATYTMTLPKLRMVSGVQRATRKRWPGFVARLRSHERKHVSIWQDCLRQVRRELPALRAPDCTRLKQRLRTTYRRIMAQCSHRHDVFDRREKHAAASLPFIKAAFGLAKARLSSRTARHARKRRATHGNWR